jgi:cold shock CspA family protein
MNRYGTVTGVFADRGFGFVTEDSTNLSVFFHAKDLPDIPEVPRNSSKTRLDELFPVGTKVEFTAQITENGLRAYNVRSR